MTLSFAKQISVPSATLINEVGGESVLLNLTSERYFGLNAVGTRMWTALTTSESVQAAYEMLLAEYEVEPEQLRSDLSRLIEELAAHGLIEVRDE